MRKLLMLLLVAIAAGTAVTLLMSAIPHTPAANPDPNHTHADFAVWIGGSQFDFTLEKYMSGLSTDANHDNEEGNRKYLHLHDGNGSVVHRHKPGLTFGDFLDTIGFGLASKKEGEWCWYAESPDHPASCESGPMHLYVDGKEVLGNPDSYVFNDGETLLLTDSTDPAAVHQQLSDLTDLACLYSKTCPWKGEPPTENCIADPTVPCVVN